MTRCLGHPICYRKVQQEPTDAGKQDRRSCWHLQTVIKQKEAKSEITPVTAPPAVMDFRPRPSRSGILPRTTSVESPTSGVH